MGGKLRHNSVIFRHFWLLPCHRCDGKWRPRLFCACGAPHSSADFVTLSYVCVRVCVRACVRAERAFPLHWWYTLMSNHCLSVLPSAMPTSPEWIQKYTHLRAPWIPCLCPSPCFGKCLSEPLVAIGSLPFYSRVGFTSVCFPLVAHVGLGAAGRLRRSSAAYLDAVPPTLVQL